MSANSTVTVLRSPSADTASESASARPALPTLVSAGLARGVCRVPVNGAAHSPQNRSSGRFSNPHLSHAIPSGAAHAVQNFAPWRLSELQLEQRIGAVLRLTRRNV
jgi:hypothetical protein